MYAVWTVTFWLPEDGCQPFPALPNRRPTIDPMLLVMTAHDGP